LFGSQQESLFCSAKRSEEAVHIEKILATARVAFAVLSLATVFLDPTEPPWHPSLAYGLLFVYVGLSFGFFASLRRYPIEPRIIPIVHVIDFLFAVLICTFTEGSNGLFFAFFTFVLLTAAYRWGSREILITGSAFLVLFLIQRLLLGRLQLNRFLIGSAYLSMVAMLFAYLAAGQRRLRQENSFIKSMLEVGLSERELEPTIRVFLKLIAEFFSAKRVLVLIQENSTNRIFRWGYPPSETTSRLPEMSLAEGRQYLFHGPAGIWFWRNARSGKNCWIVDVENGLSTPQVGFAPPESFLKNAGCNSVLAATLRLEDDLAGRLYVLDPQIRSSPARELLCVMRLLNELGPVVHNIYLWRRTRSKVHAFERARAAREIHDGIIQSLIGLRLEIEALLLRKDQDATSRRQLERIQRLLREQSQDARDLMNRLKMSALTAPELIVLLQGLVRKFGNESGIQARFVCNTGTPLLSARACHEVARIVQEALVNVRKHSRATEVQVTLSSDGEGVNLVIENDETISEMSRLQQEGDGSRRSWEPAVIRERVLLLNGTLKVESRASSGVRLVIRIPTSQYSQWLVPEREMSAAPNLSKSL
jgi:signal transduction histidine kinase